jgi:hypothetical protein
VTCEPADPARAGAGQDVDALVEDILGRRARPLRWDGLDADQAAAALAAVDRWVRWLVRRYALDHREVPPCWYRHGDLLEELSALHTAHQAAYDPAGAATGPAEWHHTLAAARARLAVAVSRSGCRSGEHRDPHLAGWAAEPPEDYRAGVSHVLPQCPPGDE